MLAIILVAVWIFCFTCILIAAYLLYRNNRVYEYRMDLLHRVGVGSRRDIINGKPWEWRYRMLESVPYNTMFYQFWRKLDSFYPDKSFIEPGGGTHE